MEAGGCDSPRCPTDTMGTLRRALTPLCEAPSIMGAKTGQETMGNEAWLILLAWGHKQSVGNQRRRKHNPSGATSCCVSRSAEAKRRIPAHGRAFKTYQAQNKTLVRGTLILSARLPSIGQISLLSLNLSSSSSSSYFPSLCLSFILFPLSFFLLLACAAARSAR